MDKKCVYYYVFWFRCLKFVVRSLFLYFFIFCTLLFLFFIWPFAHTVFLVRTGFGPEFSARLPPLVYMKDWANKMKHIKKQLEIHWTHGTYAHAHIHSRVYRYFGSLAGWLAIFGPPSSHSFANSLLLLFLVIFLLARFQEKAKLYSFLFYLVVFPQHVICATIQTRRAIRLFKPDKRH